MNTEIEHLTDNNVRLTITVTEEEFEPAIDKAFKTLAGQVRMPGFRPGKAPRALIEKQIGYEAGRSQAINDSLPDFYVDAIDEADLDPVDYPELKLNSGEESGDIVFEAKVAVRPIVKVEGYKGLEVQVDVEPIDDEAIKKQLDTLRDRHADLEEVEKPITDGAFVTIDISGEIDGEDVPGLTANDYLYPVGSALIGKELDSQLEGKKAGDEIEFTDELSEQFGENAGAEVAFKVAIKKVQTKNLPEATDEWIKENTDFETLAAWEEDTKKRMGNLQTLQAQMQVKQKVMETLADVVQDEIPESFIKREVEARLNSMASQSGVNGDQLQEYLNSLDEDARKEFDENLQKDALTAIKSDLALRAIVVAEELVATDEDLEEEIAKFAASSKEKIGKIRNRIKRPGVEKQVRLDIAREKAVKLVTDSAVGKDSAGNEIALQLEGEEGEEIAAMAKMLSGMDQEHDHDHDHEHDHDHDHKH